MGRIIISTAGTTGDLNPFIALAQECRQQGHDVTLAVEPQLARW